MNFLCLYGQTALLVPFMQSFSSRQLTIAGSTIRKGYVLYSVNNEFQFLLGMVQDGTLIQLQVMP